jgi:hypothetical protein
MRRTLVGIVLGILLASGVAALALSRLQLRITPAGDVAVTMRGPLPFRARIGQPLTVALDDRVQAEVQLDRLDIPLDETVSVPLDLQLDVPIDTEVSVAQDMDLSLVVPVHTVLTERELDLRSLEVPIDSDLYVDDAINVNFTLPVDTHVETTLGIRVPVKVDVPIKARVPIKQKVHVRDTLKLGVPKLRVPLDVNLPLRVKFPLAQSFKVKGRVRAPLHQRIAVPIRQTIHPTLGSPIAAVVKIDGRVPARLDAELTGEVTLEHPVQTRIGAIALDTSNVAIEPRKEVPRP